MPFKASPKAVDQDAGRPEAGQLDNRGWPELDECPERHLFEVKTGSGDVLAEVAGADLEANFEERWEELAPDQMDRFGRRGRRRAK